MQRTNYFCINGFLLLICSLPLLNHTKIRMLTFSGCIWSAQDMHDNPHRFDQLHEREPAEKTKQSKLILKLKTGLK